MENKDSPVRLTDSSWIKRVSPERRAHASDPHRSPSPTEIGVLVEAVEEVEVKRGSSKSKSRHHDRNGDEYSERITKVIGKEYIPKGSLELEPLPLIDEFSFSSKVFQDMFIEDQRRVKEIRRKQYGDKDYDRVRDFVMYKLEALKSQITAILKSHFNSHQSSMTKKEIQEAANQLNIDPEVFKKIHDEYKVWWSKNRAHSRSQHRKLGLKVDLHSTEVTKFDDCHRFGDHNQATYRSSSSLKRSPSKDSKTGESLEATKDESIDRRSLEGEEEAEKKRQHLLELQRMSRRARLMERKDLHHDGSSIKKSDSPQDNLPLGMALTERSHKLRQLEQQKKKAEQEADDLRKKLEQMRRLNELKQREASKEAVPRSKSRPKPTTPTKTDTEEAAKLSKNTKKPKEDPDQALIKTISSLQYQLREAYEKGSIEKQKREKTNEHLREELWMAKAEEEGLKRRLKRAEDDLLAERQASKELKEDLLRHSSPDRSSAGYSPDHDHYHDSEVRKSDAVRRRRGSKTRDREGTTRETEPAKAAEAQRAKGASLARSQSCAAGQRPRAAAPKRRRNPQKTRGSPQKAGRKATQGDRGGEQKAAAGERAAQQAKAVSRPGEKQNVRAEKGRLDQEAEAKKIRRQSFEGQSESEGSL